MILFKISQDKGFASIGKTEQEAEWYTIEPHVEKFIHSIPLGTEVGIKSEKKDNKNHLVFIIDKSKSKFNKPQETTQPVPVPVSPQVSSPEPTESVASPEPTKGVLDSGKGQAIGEMTAASLVALQGQVSKADIKEVITDIFNHYKSLVG